MEMKINVVTRMREDEQIIICKISCMFDVEEKEK